jgi:DNA-binding MarR family transcriptional regulator
LKKSTDWRERIVLRLYRPHLMADLGYGVLDAMVETAAYVLRSISEEENRQLTLSILSELRTVPTDREGAFSIPTYQQHRRGLKRHQVIQELTRLQKNGYVTSLPGYYARFRVNHVSIERADPPTPASYPPFICVRVLREENKDAALLESLQSLSDQRRFVVSPQSFFRFRIRLFATGSVNMSDVCSALFHNLNLKGERYELGTTLRTASGIFDFSGKCQ